MSTSKVFVMYHGERVTAIGRIHQVFKEKSGTAHSFSGIKGVWFGSVYEMVNQTMKVHPKAVEEPGWLPTETERDEYEAQKILVRAERVSRRKAMQLKRPHEKILRAIELLRPFCRAMSKWEQQRFMDWVSNECSKKGAKR